MYTAARLAPGTCSRIFTLQAFGVCRFRALLLCICQQTPASYVSSLMLFVCGVCSKSECVSVCMSMCVCVCWQIPPAYACLYSSRSVFMPADGLYPGGCVLCLNITCSGFTMVAFHTMKVRCKHCIMPDMHMELQDAAVPSSPVSSCQTAKSPPDSHAKIQSLMYMHVVSYCLLL